jgi:hypothetical protein
MLASLLSYAVVNLKFRRSANLRLYTLKVENRVLSRTELFWNRELVGAPASTERYLPRHPPLAWCENEEVSKIYISQSTVGAKRL